MNKYLYKKRNYDNDDDVVVVIITSMERFDVTFLQWVSNKFNGIFRQRVLWFM